MTPSTLREELMVPVLAYRTRERQYGGLSHSARQKLKQIAKGLRSDKQSPASIRSDLKSGTRLVRRMAECGQSTARRDRLARGPSC